MRLVQAVGSGSGNGRGRGRALVACAAVLAGLLALPASAAAAPALTFTDAVAADLPASPQMATALTTADVDGDGVADVLVAGHDSGSATPSGLVSVFRSGPAEGEAARADFPTGGLVASGIAAGDLDGDGVPDVVATSDGVDVLRGNGDGTFAAPVHHGRGDLRQPVLVDVDADGRLDIAAANFFHGSFVGAVDVLRNAGDCTFTLIRTDTGQHTFPSRLAAGDLNADGRADLVATGGGEIFVLLGHGDGRFASAVRYAHSYTNVFGQTDFRAFLTDTAVGDFDGNGVPDVAAAASNDSSVAVWFFPGRGDGTLDLARAVGRRGNDGGETLATGDVDGDGRLDVAVATGSGPYSPSVLSKRSADDPWPSDGYSAPRDGVSAPFPGRIATADVSGDGRLDLLTLSPFQRRLLTRSQVVQTGPVAPPEVSIAVPQDGDSYEQDQPVPASYSCTDNGVVTGCAGPAAPGEPIDTATPGAKSFTVTATDDDGETTSRAVTYGVTPAVVPTVAVTVPADGARYEQGAGVVADYVCDDGPGSGIARCDGPVRAGSSVDTSVVGSHSFTVVAVDAAGHRTSETVAYEVVPAGPVDIDPPVIRIAEPVEGSTFKQGQQVRVVYECEDLASGVETCSGSVPNGGLLSTSTAGARSFSVHASDRASNFTTRSVSYYVEAGPPPADTSAPYAVFRAPQWNGRYATGSSVTVDYSCIDPGLGASGVATCAGSVPNGSRLDTATPGRRSITVTTTDQAGNSRTSTLFYEVIDDRDGDGLSDQWETRGIDVDEDGVVDLPLHEAPYGADPDRRDLFVEMDHMTCSLAPTGCSAGDLPSHAPQPEVKADLEAAFASAPLTNPDGSTGIRLHYLVDEAVPEIALINWYRSPGSYDDVEDVKAGPAGPCNGAFGTAADRARADCEKVLRAKNQVYRWGLFGHRYAEVPGSGGIAEYPGNDFLVTVGGAADAWTRAAGSLRAAEAYTVMHELGHNLGLGHGGPRNDVNCKPNYLSVMNYNLSAPFYDTTVPLDYSGAVLPTLDEAHLHEHAGVQGPAARKTVYGVAGTARVASASGPVDWNGDGTLAEDVAADISDTQQCDSSPGEQLIGADDWSNLQYSFTAARDFASGSRASSEVLLDDEVTAEEALAAARTTDADGDGADNASDVCRAVADPRQGDLDGDGTGDACDPSNSVRVKVTPEQGLTVRSTHRYVHVAVLSTPRLAAAEVDPTTLRFGRGGTQAVGERCTTRDVDADKRADAVCSFALARAGLTTGSNPVQLTGRTRAGVPITGSAVVQVVR